MPVIGYLGARSSEADAAMLASEPENESTFVERLMDLAGSWNVPAACFGAGWR
jgi:hypothetical protein